MLAFGFPAWFAFQVTHFNDWIPKTDCVLELGEAEGNPTTFDSYVAIVWGSHFDSHSHDPAIVDTMFVGTFDFPAWSVSKGDCFNGRFPRQCVLAAGEVENPTTFDSTLRVCRSQIAIRVSCFDNC